MSRGNIAIWFDPATQWYAPSKGKQGRNQTYSDAAIQFNPQSLIRLCTKPVTIRKDRRNKDLIIKQHWMAASE